MTERERKKDNLCSHETDHGLDSKRDKGNGTLFFFFFSVKYITRQLFCFDWRTASKTPTATLTLKFSDRTCGCSSMGIRRQRSL